MAICVSVVLGLSNILIGQLKIANETGNSVRAIYLADSGIEETLYYDKNSDIISQASIFANIEGVSATRGICFSAAQKCSLFAGSGGCNPLPSIQNGCDIIDCTNCTISFKNGVLPGSLPNSNSFGMKIVISPNSTSTESFFQSTGDYGGTSRLIELDMLK